MRKLRAGETVRIVMLGDSIVNDTGNSAYDVLLERMYPGARVEVVTSVRGGTGCTYYRLENRVQSYVLDFKPDLLIVGGISHGHDPEAVRSVIRQVRAQSDPDILLMTGAVSFPPDYDTMFSELSPRDRTIAIRRVKNYRPGLERVARQEKVAFLDFRAHWDAYEQRVRKHPMWLRRDYVHANARGRQVLARVLEAYFRP
jgi:lysophospholipase L1-like esterase